MIGCLLRLFRYRFSLELQLPLEDTRTKGRIVSFLCTYLQQQGLPIRKQDIDVDDIEEVEWQITLHQRRDFSLTEEAGRTLEKELKARCAQSTTGS